MLLEKLSDSKLKGELFERVLIMLDPEREKIVNWSVTLVTDPKFVLETFSHGALLASIFTQSRG